MKKRIFSEMDNGVYRVVITTEDWSEGDVELMEQFGEPEVNVGGELIYQDGGNAVTKTLGDEFVRIMHGFPYARGFDSRDYGSTDAAISAGTAWKTSVAGENGSINEAVTKLRSNANTIPTEEVYEI